MSKELPSISELRKSQTEGATGKGTSDMTYGEREGEYFNHGIGDESTNAHGLPKGGK